MVGGRSYNQSQDNRATLRAPARLGLQAVRLPRGLRTCDRRRPHRLHPGHRRRRRADRFTFNDQAWAPGNYQNEYDGPITLRGALAHLAQHRGHQVARVDRLRQRRGAVEEVRHRHAAGGYPSISLGVFEATPFEMATAYTIFPNGGSMRPLRALVAHRRRRQGPADRSCPQPKTVARKDTTFLVTNMMRSVINEGHRRRRRAAGFSLDAAGKTGTTNDLRDAWFVGFTPELLTVVWVGLDDNQPLGLSGAQAALPIWTAFMTARPGRLSPTCRSRPPTTSSIADIDQRHRLPRVAGLPAGRSTRAFARRHPTHPVCPLHCLLRRRRLGYNQGLHCIPQTLPITFRITL